MIPVSQSSSWRTVILGAAFGIICTLPVVWLCGLMTAGGHGPYRQFLFALPAFVAAKAFGLSTWVALVAAASHAALVGILFAARKPDHRVEFLAVGISSYVVLGGVLIVFGVDPSRYF